MSAIQPIEHLIILTEREREYLVRAIESAIHVRKRHQFFLWAQGQFRGVLAHEVLVCVRLDDHGQVLQLECFHGTVLEGEDYERLCNPVDGFAVQLARQCCTSGHLTLPANGANRHDDLIADLRDNGLKNALACATERLQGGKSNHEIGAQLGISPLTVKNHVQKIYRKLNVQNRAHAVSRGISLRLLDFATG